jgi:diaminopimelate epimerase
MIQFEKYHGTGNDFIFVYESPSNPSELAKRICDRHFGIGADGLMFASESESADIKMTYYNSDGTHATMCGNGLRCFTRFVINNRLLDKQSFIVETDAGLIPVQWDEDAVTILLNHARSTFTPDESVLPLNDFKPITCENNLVYGVYVGTLHAVVFVSDFETISELGPRLTTHPNFPNEINLNFVKIVDNKHIEVRTHERGAGWTLSCGTGVCASVVVAYALNKVNETVNIKVDGGRLNVKLSSQGIQLKGPAEWIAKGETR